MTIYEAEDLPNIHYVRVGPQGAAPLVFVHPFGLDATWWDHQFDAFGREFDVIAFDLPGHGLSGDLAGAPTLERFARVLRAVLAHANVRSAHVVGISLGGMIAQTFALAHPELVASLTLVATLCTFDDAVRELLRERARIARTRGMGEIAELSNARWFPAAFAERRPDVLERAKISLLGRDAGFHAAVWEMIAALDLERRIAAIAASTFVVAGEEDVSAPVSAARRIVAAIPGATLEVAPGVGHFPPWEVPDAFNASLRRFLARTSRVPA